MQRYVNDRPTYITNKCNITVEAAQKFNGGQATQIFMTGNLHTL
jgi:hypothetical protein